MTWESILILCTGNCCRSPMAEAILRAEAVEAVRRQPTGPFSAAKRVLFGTPAPSPPRIASAGTMPAGYTHPLTLAVLTAMDIPTEGLTSDPWQKYAEDKWDLVIQLCDEAAASCPSFPFARFQTRWSLPDPSAYPGTAEERLALAGRLAERIRLKMQRLLDIDPAGESTEVQRQLDSLADL